jgi:AraC-like DNA-binding protein
VAAAGETARGRRDQADLGRHRHQRCVRAGIEHLADAEAARLAAEHGEDWRGWAAVAADLGYSDQAHLTRDFQRHLGTTPAAYVAGLRPGVTHDRGRTRPGRRIR